MRDKLGKFIKGIIPTNKTYIFVNCRNCGKKIHITPSRLKDGRGKYCSKICFYTSKENKENKSGSNNYKWKGDNVKYCGLHHWVINHKGNAKICKHCGKTGNSYQIQWANINHKYHRNLDDFISLCIRCHRKWDKKLKFQSNLIK